MSELNDQIRENMRSLSDEALLKVVETDFRGYTDEAIAFAKGELERRRLARGEKTTGAPAAPSASAPVVETSGGPEASAGKYSGFWGGFCLILAALITYTGVLVISTVIVGRQEGLRPKSEVVPALFFYAVLITLCLWAGIRRKPRWEGFLGITFLIIAALAFVARFSLSGARFRGVIAGRAMFMTAIILAVIGSGFGALALHKRGRRE